MRKVGPFVLDMNDTPQNFCTTYSIKSTCIHSLHNNKNLFEKTWHILFCSSPEGSAHLVCSLLCHVYNDDFICLILKPRFSFPLLKVTKLVNIPSSPQVLLRIKPYKHKCNTPNTGWPGLRYVKENFQKFGLRCETGKDQWFFMSSVDVLSEKSDCRVSPEPA